MSAEGEDGGVSPERDSNEASADDALGDASDELDELAQEAHAAQPITPKLCAPQPEISRDFALLAGWASAAQVVREAEARAAFDEASETPPPPPPPPCRDKAQHEEEADGQRWRQARDMSRLVTTPSAVGPLWLSLLLQRRPKTLFCAGRIPPARSGRAVIRAVHRGKRSVPASCGCTHKPAR